MEPQVLRFIQDNRLVVPGDRLLVAVSGGADSVALLDLLHRLKGDLGVSLVAAHLDHGLRPESAGDAAFVAALCDRLGIPLVSRRIAVRERLRAGGGGVEQVAREIRRDFLRQTAGAQGCRRIALGHHLHDQAETVLHRLLRGCGPAGLAAMRPRSGPFIRPLLAVSQEQLRAYLAARDLSWVEDASNRDPDLTRNRIRHQLLPLAEQFNPRVVNGLGRLAERVALEEDFWAGQVSAVLAEWPLREDGCRGPAAALRALHPALRDRVLRGLAERVRGDLRGFEEKHVTLLARLLEAEGGGQRELRLPRLWVAQRYGELWLRGSPPPTADNYLIRVNGPGVYPLPDGRILRISVESPIRGESPGAKEFSLAATGFPLEIRSWRAGDRFRPEGMNGQRKLKDVFIDDKVPREVRQRIPILAKGPELLWVVGLRRCEGWRPQSGQGNLLRVSLEESKKDESLLVN